MSIALVAIASVIMLGMLIGIFLKSRDVIIFSGVVLGTLGHIAVFVLGMLMLTGIAGCRYDVPEYTVPYPDAAPISSFGEGCVSDELCETGNCQQTYLEYELPGGMCTNDCVSNTQTCDQGYCVFYKTDGSAGHCFPSCEAGDAACREGWTCIFIVGVRLCVPDILAPH
jgi:hypothetical protein